MQKYLKYIEDFELISEAEVTITHNRIKLFSRVGYFLYSMANTAVMSGYVGAVIASKLPFNAWYPIIDVQTNSKNYWNMYLYQSIGKIMLSNFNISMETYPSYLISIKMVCIKMV